jgi:hypothetical protein
MGTTCYMGRGDNRAMTTQLSGTSNRRDERRRRQRGIELRRAPELREAARGASQRFASGTRMVTDGDGSGPSTENVPLTCVRRAARVASNGSPAAVPTRLATDIFRGLPVAAYLTWGQGRMLENNGIVPKFPIELSRDALKEGRDTQPRNRARSRLRKPCNRLWARGGHAKNTS